MSVLGNLIFGDPREELTKMRFKLESSGLVCKRDTRGRFHKELGLVLT